MRIRREGLNKVSYEVSYDEMMNMDLDVDSIKNNPNSESANNEMQKLAQIMIDMMQDHVIELDETVYDARLKVGMYVGDEKMRVELTLESLQRDVLDYPKDYDETFEVVREDEYSDDYDCENNCEYCDGCCDNGENITYMNKEMKIMFSFKNLEDAITFSRVCKSYNLCDESVMYKNEDLYIMIVRLKDDVTIDVLNRYEYISMEWDAEMDVNLQKISHIEELGHRVIENNAIEILQKFK